MNIKQNEKYIESRKISKLSLERAFPEIWVDLSYDESFVEGWCTAAQLRIIADKMDYLANIANDIKWTK